MDPKRRLDIYGSIQNGAPEHILGGSNDQNSRLDNGWLVAMAKTIPMNRRNYSHVRASKSLAIVAGRTTFLMNAIGKKWRKYPRAVCNVPSEPTKLGCTSPTPEARLGSIDPDPQQKRYSHSALLLFMLGRFSRAGSLSSSTSKPCARKFAAS